jgi:hypothetical protein
MCLTGEQYEKLSVALSRAFDNTSFEQMVQFKLGKELFALVSPDGGLQAVAFRLIKVAEKEGWTEALIRGAYVSRPNNPHIREFVEQHFPRAREARDPTEHARDIVSGLAALTAIVQRLSDPAVRLLIGEFRADFKLTSEKVEMLGRYKVLHDHLHQLHTKYLRSMTDAVATFRQNPAQLELLESYAMQLKADAGRARDVARKLRTFSVENEWIESLEQVAGDVLNVFEADPADDARLHKGLRTLRRVMAEEPIRINALLCDTASDLRLSQLRDAMEQISASLERTGDLGDSARQFRAGLSALTLLHPRLDGLLQEHFVWQWLDKEFTASDAQPGATPEERFPRWEAFKVRMLKLCASGEEKEWAKSLASLIRELEEAGLARNTVLFGRRYNKFRTVAADRFFNVDAELRDLSDQLARVADAIGDLLKVVTYGPN